MPYKSPNLRQVEHDTCWQRSPWTLLKWCRSGTPWIWLTAGAVSISLIAVLGLLLLMGWKGLTYFWPTPLYQWQNQNGERLIGQVYQRDQVPSKYISSSEPLLSNEILLPQYDKSSDLLPTVETEQGSVERLTIKVANKELYQTDFITMFVEPWLVVTTPIDLAVIKRRRGGDFFGTVVGYAKNGEQMLEPFSPLSLEHLLSKFGLQADSDSVLVEEMTGKKVSIPLNQIVNIWYPNHMTLNEKIEHWCQQMWLFLSENPRESNSEGGVFPAIFGTILLVLIMSIMVMPLGVMAAIYLHEYAKNSALTRLIHIAVINLAGVPSIVYGVFGLGFFVYTIGHSIDSLFYTQQLPTPTFGTPGLLWSALTLALLTLPVVIVATEEGLSRIPSSVRHGSLALGATQWETLYRVVLPMASPAIITGLILAIARAAGEVAPLMLVGVAKLTSNLPVDSEFPFVHLERKFMHLGYHIYDAAFQTANIEAARPLVYATSFLLVSVVIGLNLTAISIRNYLREKYRTLGQD